MNTQLSTCNEGKELSTNMKIIIPEGQGVLGYCGVLNGLLRSHHTWSWRRRRSWAQKWKEELECRSWVGNLGQEELKEQLQQQGKCWWEQIILGHVKRSWIYPEVDEGFEAGVGKLLQGPMNISRRLLDSTELRIEHWETEKLEEQLEVSPGKNDDGQKQADGFGDRTKWASYRHALGAESTVLVGGLDFRVTSNVFILPARWMCAKSLQ